MIRIDDDTPLEEALTLLELTSRPDFASWLYDQDRDDLKALAGHLIDMELAVSPAEVAAIEDVEAEHAETLDKVRDLVVAGRVDDALLLIERTLHPRKPRSTDALAVAV